MKAPGYPKFPYFDNREWCPLTGSLLPEFIAEQFSPRSQEGQCLSVILEARDLCWWEGAYFDQSFIKTAQTIYKSYDSVDQHTMTGKDDVTDMAKAAADFVRDYHLGFYFDDDVSDCFIWAVLAICKAWEALRALLAWECRETFVIEAVQDAQGLIRLADKIREYDTITKPLLIQGEERYWSLRDKAIAGGQVVKEKAVLRRNDWQRKADEYWEKHQDASKSEVAKWVASQIQKDPSNFRYESEDTPTFDSLKQQIQRSIEKMLP